MVISALNYNTTSTLLLCSIVSLFIGYECLSIHPKFKKKPIAFFITLVSLVISYVIIGYSDLKNIGSQFMWGYLPILLVSFYELKKGTLLLKDSLIFFILRVYLLSFSLVSIFLLRSHDNGLFLIFVVFSTIWLSDSFAYLGGRLMGKTPLSVHSPNKTWEEVLLVA